MENYCFTSSLWRKDCFLGGLIALLSCLRLTVWPMPPPFYDAGPAFSDPPPFQGVKISWAADTPVQSVSPWLTNPFSCLPYKKWDSWQALSPGAQTVVDAAVQVQDASAWDDRDPHQVRQALPSYRAFCSWVLPSMVCCWHWAWTFWLFTFLADLCPSTVKALVQTNLQKITSNKIFTKWDSMCGYTQTPLQW